MTRSMIIQNAPTVQPLQPPKDWFPAVTATQRLAIEAKKKLAVPVEEEPVRREAVELGRSRSWEKEEHGCLPVAHMKPGLN